MAVDTENKRVSVLNLGTGDAMLAPFVIDTSVDDEDMKYAVYLLVLKVHFLFLSA